MIRFGEKLKGYMNETKSSVSRIAEEAGLDRTVLHKYMAGSRLPKTCEEVESIAKALRLSLKDQEKLMEYYNKEIYGEQSYESFQVMKRMLEGIPELALGKEPKQMEYAKGGEIDPFMKKKQGQHFCGRLLVEHMVMRLLEQEGSEKLQIKMIAQPQNIQVMEILLRVGSGRNMEVEHIICLNNSDNNNNILNMHYILALALGNISYESFFYYENQEAHINEMTLLPVLLLVNDYALLCDYRMEQCLILHDEKSVEFFDGQYEKMKTRTEVLTNILTDINEIAATGFLFDDHVFPDLHFSYIPSMIYCLNEKICRDHLLVDEKTKETFIGLLLQAFQGMYDSAGQKEKRYQNIFVLKGLERFLEEGRFPEYPDNCYAPLDLEDRIVIVDRAIDSARKGYVDFFIADPRIVCMYEELDICINHKNGVAFQYPKEFCGQQVILVNEGSIKNGFFKFLDFMKRNRWIYAADTSLRMMEETVEKYRQILKE